jgi:glycosyltransferase involved in cell wall biosynthesis
LLFPVENIHIIYNGIQINGYEPSKRNSSSTTAKKLIIGNAGRLVEQKGHQYLIYLAQQLKSNNLDFKIIIAGKGKLKNSLVKLAQQLEVSENIEFLDFVVDIESFYKSLDIYILPSIHEGSANTIIEAMYYAKPIIAFNISSMPEVIENGKTGFLVEFGDIKKLSDNVLFLANNPGILHDMGMAARQKVSANFNINNTIHQLESIL